MTLRQSASGSSGPGVPAALDIPPLEGSLVIIQHTADSLPTGFTDLAGIYVDFAVGNAGFRLCGRIAAAAETGEYVTAVGEYVIAEFTGFPLPSLDPQTIVRQAHVPRAHVATAPVYAGEVLVLGAFIQDAAKGQILTPDAGYTVVEENDSDLNNWTITLIYDIVAPNTGAYDPGLTNPAGAGNWAAAAMGFAGALDPGGEPPAYEPPDAAQAIVEIYVAEEGADQWDVALWDTGLWSDSEWVSISEWTIFADVAWGADRAEAGILADPAAGVWTIETHDPDRVLDPSNADSPFAPELVPGLPIRLTHRGAIIRTGVVTRLWYSHADEGGRISATDAIAGASVAMVPDDTVLPNTLRARARAAIAAAGLTLTVEGDPPAGDPTLAPAPDGDFSVWTVIAHAARERLHVPWIDKDGRVRFRAWSAGLARGETISAPELIDLAAWTSDDGLFSVIRVEDHTAGITQERRATPLPRYGERVHERTEPTVFGGAWADAVLADRRDQSLRFAPGDIRPPTAGDVERMAHLEIVEDVTLALPDAVPDVEVRARILGIRVRVVDETIEPGVVRSRWRWRLITTTAAVQPLVEDGSDPPEFLVADQDPTQYLYPDGVTAL